MWCCVAIAWICAGCTAHALGDASRTGPWQWLAPKPQGNALHDVAAVRSSFVAVGARGTILVSDRRGEHWRAAESSTRDDLNAIWVAASGLWAVGDHGTVLRSRDGAVWHAVAIGAHEPLVDVAGGDRGEVVVIGSEHVFRSADAGATWQATSVHNRPAAIAARGRELVVTGGDTHPHGEQYPVFMTSRDAGATWDTTRQVGRNLDAIAIGERALIASDDYGRIYRSTNHGANFVETLNAYSISPQRFRAIGDAVWGVGQHGGLLESRDDGATWIAHAGGCVESLRGIAGAGAVRVAVGDAGAITRSLDRGATWAKQATGLGSGFSAIAADGDTIVASGTAIAISHDRGARFEVVSQAPQTALHAVWGDAIGTVYAAGEAGLVLRSTDGGASFAELVRVPETDIVDAWGSGPDDVYLLGTRTILRSTDRGNSFTASYRARDSLVAIDGRGKTDVIVVTGAGSITRSGDGGRTWGVEPIADELHDVAMLSDRELSWLNDYHARVRREVHPLLDEATRVWLDAATEPLARK